MMWIPRTYGTAKAPAFESDCMRYDVAQLSNGSWRLIYSDLDGDSDNDYFRDFPTAKAAKAYAEAQA